MGGSYGNPLPENEVTAYLFDCVKAHNHTILNGDIFEAADRMTEFEGYHDLSDYAKATVGALAAIAKEHGHHVHVMTGNHDDMPELISAVEALEEEFGGVLHIHPVALRLGAAFYTHGDLPIRNGRQEYEDMSPERRKLGHEAPMKESFKQDFSWEDRMKKRAANTYKTHGGSSDIINRVKQLYSALKDSPLLNAMECVDGETLPAVTDVVTGHTHVNYINEIPLALQIDGCDSDTLLKFHNSGTALAQSLFVPIVLTAGKDQSIATAEAMSYQSQSTGLVR